MEGNGLQERQEKQSTDLSLSLNKHPKYAMDDMKVSVDWQL